MRFLILALSVGAFFFFTPIAHANDPCLRGGDGSCITAKVIDDANGQGNPRFSLGDSISNSAIRMSDGTLLVAVAKWVQQIDSPYVSGEGINRYEIVFLISVDNGLTWEEPGVRFKGSWFVDEVQAGGYWHYTWGENDSPRLMGAYNGAGFLGFSINIVPDNKNGRDLVGISHTIACYGDLDFDSPFPGCSTSVKVDGDIFFDLVIFDQENKSFTEVGETRSVTRLQSWSSFGYTCKVEPCYGAAIGSAHPSLASGGMIADNTVTFWMSYASYRGEFGIYSSSATNSDQNGNVVLDPNLPRSELWVRYFSIDMTAPQMTSISNDLILSSAFSSSQAGSWDYDDPSIGTCGNSGRCLDERHAYYSVIRTTFLDDHGTTYPILIYGYSRPNAASYSTLYGDGSVEANVNVADLRWAYYDHTQGSWLLQGPLKDISGLWVGSQIPDGQILSAFDSSNGALDVPDINVVGTLAAVQAPQYSSGGPYAGGTTHGVYSNRLVHLATIADIRDLDDDPATTGDTTAVPVYFKFYSDTPNSWATINGIVLADITNTDSTDPKNNYTIAKEAILPGNPYVRPYFANGGPSIQYASRNIFIAVPGAPVTRFESKYADLYATRLTPTESYGTTAINYFWDAVLNPYWIDNSDGDAGSSDIPVYSQLTATNTSTTTSNKYTTLVPHLFNYSPQINEEISYTALSSTFMPSMVFTRGSTGSQNLLCGSNYPCNISYSGEQQTYGIRGWAWADVVGWLSLSCANLNSCYKASEPWSSAIGGTYYGVRLVNNSKLPVQPLRGLTWSERIGYVSFSREDSITTTNPCGNPPGVAEGDQYYMNPLYCAKTSGNIISESSTLYLKDLLNANQFPTQGFLKVEDEIFEYNNFTTSSATAGTATIVNRNCAHQLINTGLANETYTSYCEDHTWNVLVMYISPDDPTAFEAEGDIYGSINDYDASSLEVQGWARALAWRDYQQTYCPSGIGSGNEAPCDKEWGWIKLKGKWSTLNQGKFDNVSCAVSTDPNGDTVQFDSVEGYPDPDVGGIEYIEIGRMNMLIGIDTPRVFSYEGVDRVANTLTGVRDYLSEPDDNNPIDGLVCNSYDQQDVSWTAQVATSITDAQNFIDVKSAKGFLASGKAQIFVDSNLDGTVDASEIVEYTQVDETVSPPQLKYVTRGVEGTTPTEFLNATLTFVKPLARQGSYNTFAIDVSEGALEKTLVGFGWSAPTTDIATPDPFVSRYSSSVAGFGWINFTPNRLEQIYPFLRTLFSDIYVGGNYSLLGPQTTETNEYTATYLLQGSPASGIFPFVSGRDANSRVYQECLESKSEADCSGLEPTVDVPGISIDSGALTSFGRIPTHDDLATWVRGCRDKDGNLINGTGECPAPESQARMFRSDDVDLVTRIDSEGLGAVSGINRYGHHVVLCRAVPIIPRDYQRSADYIFVPNGINPPECYWPSTIGWNGEVTETYVPDPDEEVQNKVLCVQKTGGLPSVQSGSMTIKGLVGGQVDHTEWGVYFSIPSTNTHCPGSTELTLTSELANSYSPGDFIEANDPNHFYKVNHSSLGLPLVYTVPNDYGQQGGSGVELRMKPLQFNNGDAYLDWDADNNGLRDDPLPGGGFESGAVTFSFPGDLFNLDSQMRYCPTGITGVPCQAEEDTEGGSSTLNDIRQLASVGWFIDGNYAQLFAFGYLNFSNNLYKGNILGAYLIYGETEAERYCPEGVTGVCPAGGLASIGWTGTFVSHFMLGSKTPVQVDGLVISRHFYLIGKYFVQGENEAVSEPSEQFVYDGRVIANPPPGFEDVSSGLPAISQVTP